MPKYSYERPRGIDFGISRIVAKVVVPWLETGKRQLTASEAELVALVCGQPATLVHPNFAKPPIAIPAKFSELLSRCPTEVGDLIARIGRWKDKQEGSKLGRARRVIEVAMTKRPGLELSIDTLVRVAKEEGIDTSDISPTYYRGRLVDIRKEIAAMHESASVQKIAPK